MTNKQYLIDVTLKTLEVSHQPRNTSKVMCEIHYGDCDNYLRVKMQPVLNHGFASFYEQRIQIPYSSQIALVFKLFKTKKKEIFLGHYTIEAELYLQSNLHSLKLKEKLQEANAWIDFEVEIIDKQVFCDDESDYLDDEDMLPEAKSNYSQNFRSITKMSDYKPKSELNSPFVIRKRKHTVEAFSQFDKKLDIVGDLLKKHKTMSQKNNLLRELSQIQSDNQVSQTILQLKKRLAKLKNDNFINTLVLWFITAILGCVAGLMLRSTHKLS